MDSTNILSTGRMEALSHGRTIQTSEHILGQVKFGPVYREPVFRS